MKEKRSIWIHSLSSERATSSCGSLLLKPKRNIFHLNITNGRIQSTEHERQKMNSGCPFLFFPEE